MASRTKRPRHHRRVRAGRHAAAIVDLLQKEIATVVKSPEIKGRLLEMGVVPEGDSPASFAAYVKPTSPNGTGDRTGERSKI